MRLQKILYKKIKKDASNQFYKILRNLFPDIRFSSVDNKGYISIRDKGFWPFSKKVNKVTISKIITNYIPKALSIKYFGQINQDIINDYADKVKIMLSSLNGTESDNITNVITLFYTECFDRNANLDLEKTNDYIIKLITTDIQEDPDIEEPFERKGTADFLDFIGLFPKKKRIKAKLKKYIIAASLTTTISLTILEIIQSKASYLFNNFCFRAPPSLPTILYNST